MSKALPNQELLAHAISDCHNLVRAYVEGDVSLSIFRAKMIQTIEPFCGPNLERAVLKEADVELLLEYKDILFDKGGDKFEPSIDPFPRRADWVYGESNEEYGWVDQEKFKDMLKKQFLNEDR
jgi:hypothetical protein